MPDFSEASGLQPGTYTAHIKSCTEKVSQGGNPYLSWVFDVDTGGGRSMPVYYSTPYTGRGAGLFRALIQCVFPNYVDSAVNTDSMIGKPIQVVLEREEGSKYLRVAEVAPAEAEQF